MDWNRVPAAVKICCDTLRRRGYLAYPVGGCVRDLLLGREPSDWDLATSARPEQVISLFEKTVPTGIQHGTVTVLLDGMSLEVTTFRSEGGYADGRRPDGVRFDADLTGDLSRRDFSINAMALDNHGSVIDPHGGQTDLAAGVIRCVGDPDRRFGEDALRMFRAVRFAAQLGFILEEDTLAAIGRNASRADVLSGERVRVEVEKTLLSQRPQLLYIPLSLGMLARFGGVRTAVDLTALAQLPSEPIPRWTAFCALTGVDISALPVERRLRRAVLHPELRELETLAVTGGDLYALGYRGGEISAARRRLLDWVRAHPQDNKKDQLLALLAHITTTP